MSTTAEAKLTKKQRKSVAFRERKKKGKGPSDAAILDVPEAEDQELAELAEEEDTAVGISPVKADVKGKAKAVAVDTENTFEGKASAGSDPQKRKRDDDGDVNMKVLDKVATPGETKPMKKRKVEDGEDEPGRRKILFLGNLKFTTTKEAILKHFASCDPAPDVRLLTPKPRPGAPPPSKTIKSKGCAFLEFFNKSSLQQGLRLHHSVLDGRQINVELTAGGGGNSTSRVAKLKERNKELHGQRVKAAEKRKTKKTEDTMAPQEEMAQLLAGKRYSATSGVDQVPVVKRTWTVGDVQETETHRGGVKHKKSDRKRGARVKSQASGMNAIPVG